MKSLSAALKQYGVVVLAFIHIGFGRGLHGTFGVFFVAFLDAFGWTRAVTAGALSLSIIVEGIFHPVVGTLTDRLGGRKTLVLGGVVLAVGLACSATISSVWQFYFWVGIVSAAGISLIGMVPHVAIISRHYASRKATALGIAWAGGGVGIFLLVPATAAMISRWGWPSAYVGLAVVVVILVIPAVLFLLPANHVQSNTQTSGAHEIKSDKHEAQEGDWT
ncbi:MAG TPA: MFS transporter, partial [Candidatus Binatia bacterium]